MEIKKLIVKGVPMVIGMCSCAVIESMLKTHIPEKEQLGMRIARRVGIFGVGAVVSSMVGEHMEKEITDIVNIIEPMIDIVWDKEEEPLVKPVIEPDIPWTYLSTDKDGDKEPNEFIASRIDEMEKHQEDLQAMADDIRKRLKVTVTNTGNEEREEVEDGGSTEA